MVPVVEGLLALSKQLFADLASQTQHGQYYPPLVTGLSAVVAAVPVLALVLGESLPSMNPMAVAETWVFPSS